MSGRRALLVLFAVALAVRLPGIAGDLWLDEIGSLIGFVRRPLGDVLTRYVSANNHVGYSLLAHLSIGAFGEEAWALRLPALLFGAATPPALFLLVRRALGRAEALAAAALLALSYHHAYFSQNARGYTGLVLAAVVTTTLLDRALRDGGRRAWAGWAVASALSIHLLLSGLFVCVGQVLGALVLRAPVRRLAGWTAAAAALTLALHAPLLPSMWEFFTTADRDVGFAPSLALVRSLLDAALPHPALLVAAALALPVAAIGFVGVARRLPLAVFGLLVPPLLELSVALAMGVGTYPRRFLLVLPFALLVAVHGAAALSARVGGRPLFVALCAAGALAAAAPLPRLWTVPKQDYTGALAWVAERRAPGDLVAAAYVADTGARYYDPGVESARDPEALRRLVASGRRVWLLGTLVADMRLRAPELARTIDERFERRARFRSLVGDGDLVVWRSRVP